MDRITGLEGRSRDGAKRAPTNRARVVSRRVVRRCAPSNSRWRGAAQLALCYALQRKTIIHRFTLLIGIALSPSVVLALDVEKYNAQEVDLSASPAVLNSHESVFFGVSCKSGPIGTLQGVSVVKLGDTVRAGGRSFRVGVIEATRYNKDAKWGKEILAKKGDVVCVLAPNAESLPYEDDCNALWVNAPGCRVLR